MCLFGSDPLGSHPLSSMYLSSFHVLLFVCHWFRRDEQHFGWVVVEAITWILNWCSIPLQNFSRVNDLGDFAAKWGCCPKKRKLLLPIVYGFIWCIRLAMNDMVFNKMRIFPSKLVDSIITMIFSWVKNKVNFGVCNWIYCCRKLLTF